MWLPLVLLTTAKWHTYIGTCQELLQGSSSTEHKGVPSHGLQLVKSVTQVCRDEIPHDSDHEIRRSGGSGQGLGLPRPNPFPGTVYVTLGWARAVSS